MEIGNKLRQLNQEEKVDTHQIIEFFEEAMTFHYNNDLCEKFF